MVLITFFLKHLTGLIKNRTDGVSLLVTFTMVTRLSLGEGCCLTYSSFSSLSTITVIVGLVRLIRAAMMPLT